MIKLAIALFVATLLVYGVSRVTAGRVREPVSLRFLEHGETARAYTAESLSQWVRANPRQARLYAAPVLFPVDLMFMACLAAFLAVTSVVLGAATGRLDGVLWLLALLPAAFLAADLTEDTVLACLLLSPDRITAGLVEGAHVVTTLKITTLGAAMVQVVVLAVLALVWRR